MSPQLKDHPMRNGWKAPVLAFLAISATIGALWLTNRAVSPRKARWDDVVAEARTGGYKLITTEELKKFREKSLMSMLLVDTRQEWEYRSGHIKGAVNFPMEPTWWARWRKKKALATVLGTDKNRTTVFY